MTAEKDTVDWRLLAVWAVVLAVSTVAQTYVAIADEARLFCVAVVAGEVAGFLTARIDLNESVPFLSKLPVCRITTVVVDEGLRSRGIGRALIAHGDQWGKARGASQLRLEVMAFNERARALYERLGFKAQSQTMAR